MAKLSDFGGLGDLMSKGVLKVKGEVEKKGKTFDVNKFANDLASESILVVKEFGDDLQKNMEGRFERIEEKIVGNFDTYNDRVENSIKNITRISDSARSEVDEFGKHLAKREGEISNLINGTISNAKKDIETVKEVASKEIGEFVGVGKTLKAEVEDIKKTINNELVDARLWLDNKRATLKNDIPALVEEKIVEYLVENLFSIVWGAIKNLFFKKK